MQTAPGKRVRKCVHTHVMMFACVSDLIQDREKGNCCNHVLPTLIQLPEWSCQSGGDPRYTKLIMACDSLKALATMMCTRLLCPHSVHLLKNQCPNLFPALKHLKQSEGRRNSPAGKVLLLFALISVCSPSSSPPEPKHCFLAVNQPTSSASRM